MPYTIRRWMSSGGMLFDDSMRVKSSDEAVAAAMKLAGICRSLINDDIQRSIQNLKEGETMKIKRSSLKFTMKIRRTKR